VVDRTTALLRALAGVAEQTRVSSSRSRDYVQAMRSRQVLSQTLGHLPAHSHTEDGEVRVMSVERCVDMAAPSQQETDCLLRCGRRMNGGTECERQVW